MTRSIREAGGLLLLMTGLLGCAATRPPAPVTPAPVAFTTTAAREAVLDAATTLLVAQHFTLTLANDRVGLLQTDYLPMSALPADSLPPAPGSYLMRVTVTVEPRGAERYVQLAGAVQRTGRSTPGDAVMVRYRLERLAAALAGAVGASYTPQVSAEAYAAAATPPRSRFGGAARAVGIVTAVLFASTLAVGALGPGSNRQ